MRRPLVPGNQSERRKTNDTHLVRKKVYQPFIRRRRLSKQPQPFMKGEEDL